MPGAAAPRIVLAGLGPYARTMYYPLLERYQSTGLLTIDTVVDLASQRTRIEKYLAGRSIQPRRTVFLEDGLDPVALAAALEKDDSFRGEPAWGCVVATEPRAHRAFAEWAIRQGMHVLLEKPVTARDLRKEGPAEALRLAEDHRFLTELAEEKKVTVVVQAQRRAHQGYRLVKDILSDVVAEYGVPLTYLDVHHSDGTWNMPWEFASREGHPYKYGYGKLLHSGYHFVDLFCWLSEANRTLGRPPDQLGLDVSAVDARGVDAQLTDTAYERLFGAQRWRRYGGLPRPASLPDQLWGETDVVLLARLMSGGDVITTAVLSLLQSSFSARSWLELPEDTYKGNGRVRHERVTLQVGPLMTIHVHSYQDGRPDGESPFDVVVYRNRKLIGGEAVSRILVRSPDDGARSRADSLTNRAREEVFRDFLAADGRRSGLHLHGTTVRVLAAAVAGVVRSAQGGSGRSVVCLDPAVDAWYGAE